jgi:hypothetical protein
MVLVPGGWTVWYRYLMGGWYGTGTCWVDGMVLVLAGWMVWYWYLVGGRYGTGT